MGDHHPPHIFLDDTWYFISASTLNHAHFLASPCAKTLLRDQLKELIIEFDIVLRAWVILDDHYHVVLKTRVGRNLSRFFGRLHGATYGYYLRERGEEWLANCWARYPVIDHTEGDDFGRPVSIT